MPNVTFVPICGFYEIKRGKIDEGGPNTQNQVYSLEMIAEFE